MRFPLRAVSITRFDDPQGLGAQACAAAPPSFRAFAPFAGRRSGHSHRGCSSLDLEPQAEPNAQAEHRRTDVEARALDDEAVANERKQHASVDLDAERA